MTRIYKCTQLTVRGRRTACRALRAFYVPSSFEMQEYCKTNEHRKCPFYLKGIACMTPGNGGMSLGAFRKPKCARRI